MLSYEVLEHERGWAELLRDIQSKRDELGLLEASLASAGLSLRQLREEEEAVRARIRATPIKPIDEHSQSISAPLEVEAQRLQNNIEQLRREETNILKNNSQLRSDLERLKQMKRELEADNKEQLVVQKRLKEEIQQLTSQKQKLTLERTALEKANGDLKLGLQREEEKRRSSIRIEEGNPVLAEASQQKQMRAAVDLEMSEKKRQLSILQAQSSSVKSREKVAPKSALFVGQTILRDDDRDFLLAALSHSVGQIASTRLLYAFPQMVKLPFHAAVDQTPFWVVVMRLENGNVFAFFSEPALQKGDPQGTNGSIISLTNREVFFLKVQKQPARLFTYDPYYLIVGNRDLCLTLNDPNGELTSSIGTRFSFFDFGAFSATVLFGENSKKVSVIAYEVFSLTFE